MDLQLFEFPDKIKHEPVKTKKFVWIGKEKIYINGNLKEVVKKALKFKKLEATEERVKEWIENF